jgi:Tfp pilus assembly protein PilE
MKHPALFRRFTLLELLAVIVVIAILISLFATGAMKAQRKAKYVLCMSNSKQQAMSMGVYHMSSRGFFPPAGNSSNTISWDDSLAGMMGINLTPAQALAKCITPEMNVPGGAMLRCPLSKSIITDCKPRGQTQIFSAECRDYTINGIDMLQDNVDTQPRGLCDMDGFSVRVQSITRPPSEVFVITERAQSINAARGCVVASISANISSSYFRKIGYHEDTPGFFMCTLADGSSRFVSWQTLNDYQLRRPVAPAP